MVEASRANSWLRKFESAAPQVNPRLLLNENKAATLTASKGRLHAKNRHNLIF
jgi:hypothetical protein